MARLLSVEDRIIRSKVDLMHSAPFYSYILLAMAIRKTDSDEACPTMAVNAYGDLFYNEKFVSELSEKDLIFILAHEASHVSTLTLSRMGSRDLGLWNIATDLVINQMLIEDGMQCPKMALCPDHYGNWEFVGKSGKKVTIPIKNRFAEEIYEDIVKHTETVKGSFCVTADGNYKGSIDKHIQGAKDEKGNDRKGGDGEGDEPGGSGENGEKGSSAKDNADYWRSKAAQAHIAHTQARGTGSGGLSREMSRLLQPKLNWKQILSQFLTSTIPVDFTMRRPGRKSQGTGIYMPSIVKESLDVTVGVDVSGSIGQKEYKEFMNEVYGIVSGFPQVQMKIVPWDDGVIEDGIYIVPRGQSNLLFEFKPSHTGGGTTLSKFSKWFDEHAQGARSNVCIILTDGYIEADPIIPTNCPTMVVISKSGSEKILEKVCKHICCLRDYE